MKRWLALLLLLPLGACGYNRIQSLDEQAGAAQSQIEVQLQRRADLIPNLVNTVKGYAQHEEAVFTQVTQARAGLVNAIQSKDAEQMANANKQLTGALGRLMVSVEAYPQLEGRPELHSPAGRADRHGESHRRFAQRLQPGGERVQRVHPPVPGRAHGEGRPARKPRKYFTATGEAQQGPPSVDFSKPPGAAPATAPPTTPPPATAPTPAPKKP